jgi:hypothetical protein
MRPLVAVPLFLAGVTAGVVLVIACGTGPSASHAGPLDAGDDGGGSGGTCGSCTVSGPIQVVTADTDSKQLFSDTVYINTCNTPTHVLYGPGVVTDIAPDEVGGVTLYSVPKTASCDITKGRLLVAIEPSTSAYSNRPNVFGARIKLGATEEVCAVTTCSQGVRSVSINGFHPYN